MSLMAVFHQSPDQTTNIKKINQWNNWTFVINYKIIPCRAWFDWFKDVESWTKDPGEFPTLDVVGCSFSDDET